MTKNQCVRLNYIPGVKLAEGVAGIYRESLDISATRVWTAREAMKKVGLTDNVQLIVDSDSLAQWMVFNSGDSVIFSSLIDSPADNTAICVSVALPRSRQLLKKRKKEDASC